MTTTTMVSASRLSIAHTGFLDVMAARAMLASQATSAATIGSFVYGIDEAGDLSKVNAADKTSTSITSLSPNTATNALGYDSSRNPLFIVDKDLKFQVWDRSSSSTTNLGNDRSVGLQLSFSENGSVLYGHRYTDGSWYTVDASTGGLTAITGFVTIPTGGVGFRDVGGAGADHAGAGMGIAGAVVHQVRRRKKLAA